MSAVLMISYSASLGGAERVLIDFAQALDGEHWLACPEGPLAGAARERGFRLLPLPARAPELRASLATFGRALRSLADHRREVRALIRDLEPELVLVNGMRSGLAALLPSPPRDAGPIVFLHHDMVPGAAIGQLVRLAARRSALTVVPSRGVALDLGPRVPALVVHPGVEPDRFASAIEPDSPPRVLVLGAIVGWKRPDLALEAFSGVRAQVPEARLRLVGAPIGRRAEALLARLRHRAERPDLAGAVDFVGAVTDPAEELARASCLLHCAHREPFGIALIEALAAGRPVVAPAEAGPEEIVDERCGVLYPPGDAGAAARAVAGLLRDPDGRTPGSRPRRRGAASRRQSGRSRPAVTGACPGSRAIRPPWRS
jgi:glycosyltransferase involved in cell wall biosynthesis